MEQIHGANIPFDVKVPDGDGRTSPRPGARHGERRAVHSPPVDPQAPVDGPGVAVVRGDAPWPSSRGRGEPSPFASLRPAGAGTVLDEAFVLLRSRFGRLVGLAACLYVPIRLLDLVTMIASGDAVDRTQIGPSLLVYADGTGWSWVVLGLQSLALSVLGLCVGHLAMRLAAGEDASFGELARLALRRGWVAVLVVPLGLLVKAPLSCLPLVGFVLGDALVFLSSVVAGAEGLGPWRAWLRGMQLTRRSYASMLGVVLGGLVISQALRISFYAGPVVLAVALVGPEEGVLTVVSQLGALVVLVAEPLTACIAARAYLELRCRTEGLDLRRRIASRYLGRPEGAPA